MTIEELIYLRDESKKDVIIRCGSYDTTSWFTRFLLDQGFKHGRSNISRRVSLSDPRESQWTNIMIYDDNGLEYCSDESWRFDPENEECSIIIYCENLKTGAEEDIFDLDESDERNLMSFISGFEVVK